MSEASGRTETWTRMNHLFAGKSDEGYAVCENCEAREDSSAMLTPCMSGPVMERESTQKKAGDLVARRAGLEHALALVQEFMDRDDTAIVMDAGADGPDDLIQAAIAALDAGARVPYSIIPGSAAAHAIITDVCRQNRTDEGAWQEAAARLHREFQAIARAWDVSRGAKVHLVLTVERPNAT